MFFCINLLFTKICCIILSICKSYFVNLQDMEEPTKVEWRITKFKIIIPIFPISRKDPDYVPLIIGSSQQYSFMH